MDIDITEGEELLSTNLIVPSIWSQTWFIQKNPRANNVVAEMETIQPILSHTSVALL